MVINSLNEGTLKGAIQGDTPTDPPSQAPSVGTDITAIGRFTAGTLDQATDASFTVSGINDPITRSTNSIADVIPGITLNLAKTGTTTITVSDDAPTTTSVVQEFVDMYNDMVEFLKENNIVAKESEEDDALNIFGPLASTSLDDSTLASIRSIFAGAAYTDGTEIRIFPDLGITTQQDGTLAFDTDKFGIALAKEPDSIRNIFYNVGDPLGSLTSAGGVIDPVTRFQGLIDLAVKGNKKLIDNLNDSIARAEDSIARQEQTLRQRFAALEKLVSQLQSQQAALTSALAGLAA